MELTNDFFKNINHNIFYNSIDLEDDKCMICGLAHNENNRVTLDCGHVYHDTCVNLIIKKSPLFVCPYCKDYQAKININKLKIRNVAIDLGLNIIVWEERG